MGIQVDAETSPNQPSNLLPMLVDECQTMSKDQPFQKHHYLRLVDWSSRSLSTQEPGALVSIFLLHRKAMHLGKTVSQSKPQL